jgi:hypothetical protein
MITNQTVIKDFQAFDIPAITLARMYYRQWKSDVPFDQDVQDYLENGVVISRPDLFGMARFTQAPDGQLAWFVRVAVGNLKRLVPSLPCKVPWICFCRRKDPRLRYYGFDRFLQLTKE